MRGGSVRVCCRSVYLVQCLSELVLRHVCAGQVHHSFYAHLQIKPKSTLLQLLSWWSFSSSGRVLRQRNFDNAERSNESIDDVADIALCLTDHVLHFASNLKGEISCSAAGTPSDIAECWVMRCHAIHPVKKVFNSLHRTCQQVSDRSDACGLSCATSSSNSPRLFEGGKTRTNRRSRQPSGQRSSYLRPS